jgi:hypothetical protein
MRHARADYNRIIDPSGKIPEDEPVFLIRGHDRIGPSVLRFYATMNKAEGGKPEISEMVEKWADEMVAWQLKIGKSKMADLP